MSDRLDLSVVISTFNTRTMLAACLESVLRDLERTGLSHEVIVVDDASTDGSADMVATRFPQVRLLRHADNQGYARASNAGIRAAAGATVFLLNSDTVVVPGSIATLLGALNRGEGAAAGPRLLNADGTDQRSCWRFPLTWLIGNTLWLFHLGILDDYRDTDHQADRPVDWLSSAALMIRSDALASVGLFDERFGVYGVDVDWALRARRRGRRSFYVPSAEVIHHGRASWGDARDRMYWDHMRSHTLLFYKHYGLAGLAFYRAAVLANSAPRMIFWGLLALLGKERLRGKAAHFRRLVRWSVLGDSRS